MKKVLSLIIAMLIIFSAVPSVTAAERDELTYEQLTDYVEKVNGYWIATHKSHPGYHWDPAAYYTGCMDAYYLTGIEAFRQYAEQWAIVNRYRGHGSNDKATWSNNNVYHADNQTCFQTYIDLYNLDTVKEPAKLERTLEIIDAQIETGSDAYWTWCDAIYMAAPVHAKLYALTGDEKYLDSLYRFFDFSKRRMYDGDGGINYEGEKVNLFFRDPNYIKSKIDGQKNIWARGTGWVMAAYARIFEYIPENWEHYDYFLTTYREMAEACISCVKVDNEGRMYWTQSMLPVFPVSDQNPYGYETSGTAFITYSLFYGVNNGLLEGEEYENVAKNCLRYLTEVAIQDTGFAGYIQPIGAAATTATTTSSNYNFGVGATISALCEAARYTGGMQGDIYPYLTRKTMGSAVFKINSPFVYDGTEVKGIDAAPFIDRNNRTLVPLRALSEALGAEVEWNEADKTVYIRKNSNSISFKINDKNYIKNNISYIMDSPAVIKDDRTYVPLRAVSEALGKNVYWNDEFDLIVIGPKEKPFNRTESEVLYMLSDILTKGAVPYREVQEYSFKVDIAEFKNPDRILIKDATASKIPEPENPPENAFDDDISSRWAADGDSEIVFDLGNEQYVEKIAVAFWKYAERRTIYEIHVSNDGSEFTEIFNGEATQGQEFCYHDIKQNIRYIKLIGHGNTTNNWTSVLELIPYSK